MAPRYLTVDDLTSLVGASRVSQYFDDDLSGDATEESTEIADVLQAAENEADGYLRKSWDIDSITLMAGTDGAFLRHVAWVALEFAAERRPEFCDPEGKGPYWAYYERSVKFFTELGKGNRRSIGESVAGTSPRIGGIVQPTVSSSVPRFVFAKDRDNPSGHGDF